MSGKLQHEIRKSKPFDSVEQEAALNILRTAELMLSSVEPVLKAAGISGTQYNVLRILRGHGGDGLACGEISEQMINREPDMTRLLDRLEKSALITRQRQQHDRRVVRSCITEKALQLLAQLDEPVIAAHRRQLGHMNENKLRELVTLLEEARTVPLS
jgi:MarR family transcriptional regulator, organic hydroperoxide resistance regulator